eukprot:gnl/MRDRNA2_/MRDRNA2_72323_c0_seq1.p1 gnl/MRDRNA2_/MRDRNA2_72323_c0~~gnl/MRDRNA2_/MRDRNA2_72323_c0_seq1.p1  ORF type:complete len:473 (+),score=98.51 gnl/MRDRNA2_/MRDRNA2_72323_c0_seq1:139-1419(+)
MQRQTSVSSEAPNRRKTGEAREGSRSKLVASKSVDLKAKGLRKTRSLSNPSQTEKKPKMHEADSKSIRSPSNPTVADKYQGTHEADDTSEGTPQHKTRRSRAPAKSVDIRNVKKNEQQTEESPSEVEVRKGKPALLDRLANLRQSSPPVPSIQGSIISESDLFLSLEDMQTPRESNGRPSKHDKSKGMGLMGDDELNNAAPANGSGHDDNDDDDDFSKEMVVPAENIGELSTSLVTSSKKPLQASISEVTPDRRHSFSAEMLSGATTQPLKGQDRPAKRRTRAKQTPVGRARSLNLGRPGKPHDTATEAPRKTRGGGKANEQEGDPAAKAVAQKPHDVKATEKSSETVKMDESHDTSDSTPRRQTREAAPRKSRARAKSPSKSVKEHVQTKQEEKDRAALKIQSSVRRKAAQTEAKKRREAQSSES